MRYLLLTFLCASCQTVSTHRFDTEQGERLVCRQAHVQHCGLALEGCGEKASVIFECLKNVKYVGPWSGPTVPADYAPEPQED
jgi:hypothetical protein